MNLAQYIDHTALKASTTSKDIKTLCQEAKEHNFAAVCVNSTYVEQAKKELADSKVKVCTVVGFPLGASPSEVKSLEAKMAIENGADEIDMVLNIGKLIDGKCEEVLTDIVHVTRTVQSNKKLIKVIIETCLLNHDQKVKACELVTKAGADFIKTSTGFSDAGATLEDISLMKKYVGSNVKIKASGGVRDKERAKKVIELGANRIGTSSGVQIISGEEVKSTY